MKLSKDYWCEIEAIYNTIMYKSAQTYSDSYHRVTMFHNVVKTIITPLLSRVIMIDEAGDGNGGKWGGVKIEGQITWFVESCEQPTLAVGLMGESGDQRREMVLYRSVDCVVHEIHLIMRDVSVINSIVSFIVDFQIHMLICVYQTFGLKTLI